MKKSRVRLLVSYIPLTGRICRVSSDTAFFNEDAASRGFIHNDTYDIENNIEYNMDADIDISFLSDSRRYKGLTPDDFSFGDVFVLVDKEELAYLLLAYSGN